MSLLSSPKKFRLPTRGIIFGVLASLLVQEAMASGINDDEGKNRKVTSGHPRPVSPITGPSNLPGTASDLSRVDSVTHPSLVPTVSNSQAKKPADPKAKPLPGSVPPPINVHDRPVTPLPADDSQPSNESTLSSNGESLSPTSTATDTEQKAQEPNPENPAEFDGGIALKYTADHNDGPGEYDERRAYMPVTLQTAIGQLHQSVAQTEEQTQAATNQSEAAAAAMVALTEAFEAKKKELQDSYDEAKAARKAKFDETVAAKEEERKTQLEAVEAQKAEAMKAEEEKAEAENNRINAQHEAENNRIDAQHKSELQQFEERKAALKAEQEKVAAVKTEKITADAKASNDAREAVSKEKQDSVDRKIKIETQDFDMKKYIQTTLAAAHTDRNNVAGLVQQQVESLAGAAEKVAETIHYIHQNRVDGLNKGVYDKIQGVDDKLIQGIGEVTAAVDRNNVRAHALAQDIVDRHGAGNFRKAKVCTTFIEEGNKEVDGPYFTTVRLPGVECGLTNAEGNTCKGTKTEGNTCSECKKPWLQDKADDKAKNAYIAEKYTVDSRRRLASNYASMSPSEQALERRRLANRPKSHIVVLEQLLEEINRLN